MEKSKSIVLPQYNDNLLRAMLSLKLEKRNIPELKPDEVLVKMEGAPCNPSDIAFLRGGYNIVKTVPAVPGFEGAGEVVKTGIEASELFGKRVSCFIQSEHDGTWAEFFIARKHNCFVLDDILPADQAACFAINPMTAWALFELIEKSDTKALVQNAASGQVGRFIQFFADKNGIDVINIVRKETQVEQLKNDSSGIVLNSSSTGFQEQLQEVCKTFQPTMALDAVGGEMTATLLNSLPTKGQVVVYGGLSGERIAGIDPMGIIFKGKKLLGFNLNDWLERNSYEDVQSIAKKLQHLFIRGELRTSVQGSFPLDQAVAGIRTYIKSMSAGKIIFTP